MRNLLLYPNKIIIFVAILVSLLLIFSCSPNADTPSNNDKKDDDLTAIEYAPKPYNLVIPKDFPAMSIPADNPLTEEGIQLGRRLFYDPILSLDSTISCASCHLSKGNFTDNQSISFGVNNTAGRRSSMSLLNVGFFNKGLFWDGRSTTLEEQGLKPVEDPVEMHESWQNVIYKLKRHKDYPTFFRKAFGISTKNDITKELAAKALAQFERIMVSSGNSKYDRIRRGEEFFTEDELAGYLLFFDADADGSYPDAQCGHCHNGILLTTNEFFNNGIQKVNSLEGFKDKGLGEVSNKLFDNGKFRTPSLRNITLSAPYMHDGRFKTLKEVINHYTSGGNYADNLDPLIQQINGITEKHKEQILIFLKTLTDTTFIQNTALQSPFK